MGIEIKSNYVAVKKRCANAELDINKCKKWFISKHSLAKYCEYCKKHTFR